MAKIFDIVTGDEVIQPPNTPSGDALRRSQRMADLMLTQDIDATEARAIMDTPMPHPSFQDVPGFRPTIVR